MGSSSRFNAKVLASLNLDWNW